MTAENEQTEASVAPLKRRRWLLIALFASLGVNLLVAGAMAGAAWRFRHGPPMVPMEMRAMNGNLLRFAGALPQPRRAQLWRETDEERRALRPLRAEVLAAQDDVRAALLAEPFDISRFEAAQAKVLAAEVKARSAAQKLFVVIAGKLTREERAAFAQAQMGGHGSSQGHGPGEFKRRKKDEGDEGSRR